MKNKTYHSPNLQSKRSSRLFLLIAGLTVPFITSPGNYPANAAEATPCSSHLFKVGSPHPTNTAYPDPKVEVNCTSGKVTVQSNGIPDYEYTQMTPNRLRGQQHRFSFPLRPTRADRVSTIPRLGAVGVALNGIPLFGPNEGPQPVSEAWGDPVYNGILDSCLGHTARGGVYHYHALLVECIQKSQPENDEVLLGFAFDGFPIYGSYGCADAECTKTIQFQSSWKQTGNPKTDVWEAYSYVAKDGIQYLDECNGRVGPNGKYRYHATETFPYILGCYHGVATRQESMRGNRERRGPPRHRGRRGPPRHAPPPF